MRKGQKEAQFNSQSQTKFQIHFQIRNAQTCEERDRCREAKKEDRVRGRRQRKRHVKEQKERFKCREETKRQTQRGIQ